MQYRFIVGVHEHFGSKGLVMLDGDGQPIPGFDANAGMGTAHDIMEHFPGHYAGPENELMALGAAYYIRHEWGLYSSLTGGSAVSVDEKIADMGAEVHHLLRYEGDGEYTLRRPPHGVRPLPAFAAEGMADLYEKRLADERNEDDPRPDVPKWEEIIPWLTLGYRKATKRFSGLDRYGLCVLFIQLERLADKALANAEEGAWVKFSVNFTKLKASCTVCRSPFYDAYDEDYMRDMYDFRLEGSKMPLTPPRPAFRY